MFPWYRVIFFSIHDNFSYCTICRLVSNRALLVEDTVWYIYDATVIDADYKLRY